MLIRPIVSVRCIRVSPPTPPQAGQGDASHRGPNQSASVAARSDSAASRAQSDGGRAAARLHARPSGAGARCRTLHALSAAAVRGHGRAALGGTLIPVDELERLLAERRRPPRRRRRPNATGRPPTLPTDVVERIRVGRAEGKSLRQIAAELNADGTPTAHDGMRWWPSTVRSVLIRAASL
jgi:hypothetical protein